MKSVISKIAWVVLGGFILCFWGLYNGYPFVCGTFSTVVSRYQGRMIWLPILFGLIVVVQVLERAYLPLRLNAKSDKRNTD